MDWAVRLRAICAAYLVLLASGFPAALLLASVATSASADPYPCTREGWFAAVADGGGPHTFACTGPTVLDNVYSVIETDVVLDGGGLLALHGNSQQQVVEVAEHASAELRNLTITGGGDSGIVNFGALRLVDCTVAENSAPREYEYQGGGGIYTSGELTLVSSTVSGNSSRRRGGGILAFSGSVTLIDSTVAENRADPPFGIDVREGTLTLERSDAGDGVYTMDRLVCRNSGISTLGAAETATADIASCEFSGGIQNGGRMTIRRSLISGNDPASDPQSLSPPPCVLCFPGPTASPAISNAGDLAVENTTLSVDYSPAISNSGSLRLVASTLAANGPADWFPSAIWNDERGEVWLRNTLLAGDCGGPGSFSSQGSNLESPGSTCGLSDPSDLAAVEGEGLALGPLADNGGATRSHALLPGSVALDATDPASCIDAAGEPLRLDQRGAHRPQDGTGDGAPACDIGAFELGPARCGNGVLEAGEVCDDGDPLGGDGCSALCLPERCGDSLLEPETEGCDDGNTAFGDGCTGRCEVESPTQEPGQRRCLVGILRREARLFGASSRHTLFCLRLGAAGRFGPSFVPGSACGASKIWGRAVDEVYDFERQRCAAPHTPDFAFTGAQTVDDSVRKFSWEGGLSTLFGSVPAVERREDTRAASCQRAALAAYGRVSTTWAHELDAAVRAALGATPPIRHPLDLAEVVWADLSDSLPIARSETATGRRLASRCGGLALDGLFACGGVVDAGDLAGCVIQAAERAACRAGEQSLALELGCP